MIPLLVACVVLIISIVILINGSIHSIKEEFHNWKNVKKAKRWVIEQSGKFENYDD